MVLREIRMELRATERLEPDEFVHTLRQHAKKVRAALRLGRSGLGTAVYHRENYGFRDLAQSVGPIRDTEVVLDAFDKVLETGGCDAVACRSLRGPLERSAQAARQQVLHDEKLLQGIGKTLKKLRRDVRKWHMHGGDWSIASRGLKRVYRAGRDAFQSADREASLENLHEWRKQSKYLRHVLELIEPAWPEVLQRLIGDLHTLSDLVGDYRDLSLLHDAVSSEQCDTPRSAARLKLLGLIDGRLAELQRQIFDQGRLAYRLRPRVFIRRVKRHWKEWRS